MSRAHHKDVEDVEPQATNPEGERSEPPGKVVIDSRGHNVWQWAKDVLESTSVLLKRLENKDLSLEPTRKVPILGRQEKAANAKAADAKTANAKGAKTNAKEKTADAQTLDLHPALQRDRKRDGGGGFDPYNSR